MTFFFDWQQDGNTAEVYWNVWREGASTPIADSNGNSPRARRFATVAEALSWLREEFGPDCALKLAFWR